MTLHIKLWILVALVAICHGQDTNIKIAISHCNDVSAQIQPYKLGTHRSSKAPEECVKDQEKCYGGFINLVHWMRESKTSDEDFSKFNPANILRLVTGNMIGGESGWISSLEKENGWNKYGGMIRNHIKPTVLSLGMKEFGAGLRQTMTFMKAVWNYTDPLSPDKEIINTALANTCDKSYSGSVEKDFCQFVKPVERIEVLQDDSTTYPIGIVGFVTPTVERLSLPGNLEFSAIVDGIRKAIASTSNIIKTFIAVGDGNLNTAKSIIDTFPQIKLVIFGSGFSNTPNMSGEYPLRHNNGFIATAGRYGSSVGKMVLNINKNTGDITVKNSELKDTSYPEKLNAFAMNAKNDVTSWEGAVIARKGEEVGFTRVDLAGGEICWRDECNLGNLMADAVVHCVLQEFTTPFGFPIHSVWHGGAFFEDFVKGGGHNDGGLGRISKFDVHKWLPYHNNVHLVKVRGIDLLQVFNLSASGINPSAGDLPDWRQFLQVSNGLEVYYDNTTIVPIVTRVRIATDEKGVPRLRDLQTDKDYYLAIPTYLYEGRGVYNFDRKIWTDVVTDKPNHGFDDDCLGGYIKALKHVTVGFEERIWINNGDSGGGGGSGGPVECKGTRTAVTVILTIVFFTIFLAIIFVGYFYVLPRLRRPIREEYPPNQL